MNCPGYHTVASSTAMESPKCVCEELVYVMCFGQSLQHQFTTSVQHVHVSCNAEISEYSSAGQGTSMSTCYSLQPAQPRPLEAVQKCALGLKQF